MSYAQQQITVNTDTGKVVKSTATPTLAPEKPVSLYATEVRVLCFTFVDSLGVAAAFPATATFDFGVDNALASSATGALMAYSSNAAINDLADWSAADPTAGKIGVRVDCTGAAFEAGLDPVDGEAECFFQLRMFPPGETNHSTLVQDTCKAFSTVISKRM